MCYVYYNQELKETYIEEKETEIIVAPKYLERLFSNVSEMENRLDKDVCNFTYYEIEEYYKLFNTSSLDTLVVVNSHFSMYTQWCLQKSLVMDSQNHFLEFELHNLKDCLNKALYNMKYVTREIVLKWVDELPNPKDQFVILGLFEGIKGKDFCELANLRRRDINGNTLKLCTDREIKVSNKLISIINDCINEDKYYSISGKGVKTMPLIDKGFIIKDYPNARDDVSDFQRGRKIYTGVMRILKYFDVDNFISANSINESGKIQMIKERSKALGMSCKDYIYSDNITEVEKKYNYRIVRSIFWLKNSEYLEESLI